MSTSIYLNLISTGDVNVLLQIVETKQVEEPIKIIHVHHLFVRIAHWLNIPTLLLLIMSGLSIYWASPVIKVPTKSGQVDVFQMIGSIAIDYFGQKGSPRNWFYDHFAMGSGNLAYALNVHWFCAYLLMAIAILYLVGSFISGSYKALLPRSSDLKDALIMFAYYLRVVPFFILRKNNPHPIVATKYNALQRFAYFSVSVATALSISTGWAIHKPSQLGLLQAAFGGYDLARLWHFILIGFYVSFVVPHVVLVIVDGFDCFRSMVVGWSTRIKHE